VDAIHTATIQVLLADGLARLTTTRVAERAGVSVGTLYQYFPNKEALLYAILLSHFEDVAEAFESIATGAPKAPLDELADNLANAYVQVKTANPDLTAALYMVAGAIDQVRLSKDIYKRLQDAVVRLVENASDASFDDPSRAAFTLLSALAGLSRGSFGKMAVDRSPLERLGEESRLLAQAYLRAAAKTVSNVS
tara:strand:- start:58056 stop:58637 length:582 start_codon:yes stop_codon:yes gene_type:complete